MEETKQNTYLKNFYKIFPIFYGLSGDLLFYVAIDTLFYTVVKGFLPEQLSLLTTVSALFCILLKIPITKIIEKIGNTNSVRVGALGLILSSVMITFLRSFQLIMLARIIYILSIIFINMQNTMLKNNLTILNKEEEYAKIINRGNIVYSTITMIIAFIAGYMFNINNYLPMYFCILFCIITFAMSLYLKDISTNNINKFTQKGSTQKIKISKMILIILVFFGIFYSLVDIGQGNGKLLIQYELNNIYDVSTTATYLGIIVFLSRISRIIGNISFGRIYNKYKDKVSILLCIMITLSFVFLTLGYFFNSNVAIKFILMTIGFCIILAIRDAFKVYIYDLSLKVSTEKERQSVTIYIEFARRIGAGIVSLIATLMLTKVTLIYVIICLLILAVIELALAIRIYKMIRKVASPDVQIASQSYESR